MSEQIISMSTTQEEKPTLINLIDSEITKQEELVKSIRLAISNLKLIKKEYVKEIKVLEKEANKKKKKDPNAAKRLNNGFSKPGPISPELASFMGESSDFQVSRTEVTKFITKYVKENKLTLPDNGRVFTFESKDHKAEALKLKKLLKPEDGAEVTWFNLQKYLAPHYPKKDATTVSATTVEPPITPAVVEKTEPKPVRTSVSRTSASARRQPRRTKKA